MKGWRVRKKLHEVELDELRTKIIHKHKKCKGTGFIEVVSEDDSGLAKRKVKTCVCRKKYNYRSLFLMANIPIDSILNQQIYGKVVIDSFSNEKIEIRKEVISPYIKNIVKAASTPFGFLFLGKNGVGKTFIGLKILYYAIVNGFTVHNMEMADFLKISRKMFDGGGQKTEDLLREISNVDFLMIDEIGNESKRSEYSISELKSIYKKRVSMKRPTILISNYSHEEFGDTYGASVSSMVNSHSRVFDFSTAADVRATKCNGEMQEFFKDIKGK